MFSASCQTVQGNSFSLSRLQSLTTDADAAATLRILAIISRYATVRTVDAKDALLL